MARTIKARPNYMQDSINMRRTIAAVQADPNAPAEWKTKVIEHLHAAMRLFLERDSVNVTGQHPAQGSGEDNG